MARKWEETEGDHVPESVSDLCTCKYIKNPLSIVYMFFFVLYTYKGELYEI